MELAIATALFLILWLSMSTFILSSVGDCVDFCPAFLIVTLLTVLCLHVTQCQAHPHPWPNVSGQRRTEAPGKGSLPARPLLGILSEACGNCTGKLCFPAADASPFPCFGSHLPIVSGVRGCRSSPYFFITLKRLWINR